VIAVGCVSIERNRAFSAARADGTQWTSALMVVFEDHWAHLWFLKFLSITEMMHSPTETVSSASSIVPQGQQKHVFDDVGDLIFSFSDDRQIQVHSKVISVVTTFFDHMKTISARKPPVSSFEASEFDAILLFCQVCYHRGSEIPLHLNGKALGDVAVVAMDFDCVLDLLAIAYILNDCDNFKHRSRELILHMGEESPYRAFPVPAREIGGMTDLQNQLPESVFGRRISIPSSKTQLTLCLKLQCTSGDRP
jgi:hypothetical protein